MDPRKDFGMECSANKRPESDVNCEELASNSDSSVLGSPASRCSDRMNSSVEYHVGLNPHKRARSCYIGGDRNLINSAARRLSNKSGSTGTDLNVSPSRRDISREELSKTFEEWMRLVADNKINAKNSWDLALIDYFYEMTHVGEGGSINFQRASCTLDGCVKIYTSRVDSVNSETRRLLDGLVGSYPPDKDKGYDDNTANRSVSDSPGKKGFRKKHTQRQTSTLEENIENLNVQNIDMELVQDPLFKKASADFDKSGAHALLLNTLSIDRNGKIILNSSEASLTYTHAEPIPDHMVDIGSIIYDFAEKLMTIEQLEVYPEVDFSLLMLNNRKLQDFTSGMEPAAIDTITPENTEISIDEQYQAMVADNYPETPKRDYDSSAQTPVVGVGTNISYGYDDEKVKPENSTSIPDNIEFLLDKQPNLIEDEFSYFDNTFTREEDTTVEKKKTPKQKKACSKPTLNIDFSQEPHLTFKDVINVSRKPSRPLTQTWHNPSTDMVSCKTRKKDLFTLFLKPDVNLIMKDSKSLSDKYIDSNIISTVPGQRNYIIDINPPSHNDSCNQLENPSEPGYEDTGPLPLMGSLHESDCDTHVRDFPDKDRGGALITECENQGNALLIRNTSSNDLANDANSALFGSRILNINADRAFSKINSRSLRKSLWKVISDKQNTNDSSKKARMFSELFASLKNLYPEKNGCSITPAHSFVCLLDLAREKNLAIVSKYADLEQNIPIDLELIQDPDL